MTLQNTPSLIPQASNCARNPESMVRPVAPASRGASRSTAYSSSLLVNDDGGRGYTQEFLTTSPIDEASDRTGTSSVDSSKSAPPAVPQRTQVSLGVNTRAGTNRVTDSHPRNIRDGFSAVNQLINTAASTASVPNERQPHYQHGLSHSNNPTMHPRRPHTTPHSPSEQPSTESFDFSTVFSNYMSMLSSQPQEHPAVVEPVYSAAGTVNPAELTAPEQQPTKTDPHEVVDARAGDCGLYSFYDQPMNESDSISRPTFNASESRSTMPPPSPEFDEFLTSASPYTPMTSFEDSFDSPLLGDSSLLTEPLIAGVDDMRLFGGADYDPSPFVPANKPQSSFAHTPSLPDTSTLYTMSPTSPLLDMPVQPPFSSSAMDPPPPPVRRKSIATGTRKNITPDALVPLDAPTQPRKYITPSGTSKKEVPASFARKRARSQAFSSCDGDDDDELRERCPPPSASELEHIEWKRRQNTLAARKSRKRKLEHQQFLEARVETLTAERNKWKTRAETLQTMLHSHGIPFAQFSD